MRLSHNASRELRLFTDALGWLNVRVHPSLHSSLLQSRGPQAREGQQSTYGADYKPPSDRHLSLFSLHAEPSCTTHQKVQLTRSVSPSHTHTNTFPLVY